MNLLLTSLQRASRELPAVTQLACRRYIAARRFHGLVRADPEYASRTHKLSSHHTNVFQHHQRLKSFQRNPAVFCNRSVFLLSKFCVPAWSQVHTQSYEIGIQKRFISEDRETRALTVWTNLKELRSSPVPALVLGFSGLIPFVSVPVYMTMSQLYMPQIAFAQLAYGAVILSFLGGVRWGFVVPDESYHKPDWFNLGYSVTPSLVAWVGLLLPDPVSVFTVMAGIAGSAYFDTVVPGYPPWFKGLRFVLSLCAVLSLWTTFICQFFLQGVKNKEE
ncbi:transmembrane protein 69-like [Haliotis cracherodii]|uniref:transmembrane protein 69-like n=1 Tax=Haliotis cracherodii TaxID=6455 RepID=UPI0039EB5317